MLTNSRRGGQHDDPVSFFFHFIINNISYTDKVKLPATNYARGLDLQFELKINDKIVSQDDKYAPFKFFQSLSELFVIDTNENLTSISIIKNSNYIICSTYHRIYLYDFTDSNFKTLIDIKVEPHTEYHIISMISIFQNKALFAVTYTSKLINEYSSVEKQFLSVVCYNLISFTVEYTEIFYPNFKISKLRVVTSSDSLFSLILVETNRNTNNRVQILFGNWSDGKISLRDAGILNFYTMNLDKFLCEGADGYYSYNGYFEVYIVDSYYGLRVLNYSNSNFKEVFNHKISQTVKSIGYCGKQILVGCYDTSVLIFTKYNEKFRFSKKFFLYNNYSANYKARSGFINCNDYYDPSFFSLPIRSPHKSVIRIINMKVDYPSSILRDITISNYPPNVLFYSNLKFYNSSLFISADIKLGKIYGYNLQNPYIDFPKYSHSEFKKVEKKWGNSPYKYSIFITSGNITTHTQNFKVDRGAVNFSSSSDSLGLETWKVVLLVISCLSILGVIGFLVYKYFFKQRKSENTNENVKLTNHSEALYESSAFYSIKGPKAY